MSKKYNYTVIRLSGRCDFHSDTDYYGVLKKIAYEYGSAGGDWDRPNMLLEDGEVVVASGLTDIAWSYGQRSRVLHDELQRKIREEFKPTWWGSDD